MTEPQQPEASAPRLRDIGDEEGCVTPEALAEGCSEVFECIKDDLIQGQYDGCYRDLLTIWGFIERSDKVTGLAAVYEGMSFLASAIRLRNLADRAKEDKH